MSDDEPADLCLLNLSHELEAIQRRAGSWAADLKAHAPRTPFGKEAIPDQYGSLNQWLMGEIRALHRFWGFDRYLRFCEQNALDAHDPTTPRELFDFIDSRRAGRCPPGILLADAMAILESEPAPNEPPAPAGQTPDGMASDASGEEVPSPRVRPVNLGDNAGTKGQRREHYHCSQIVTQGEDDPIITLCHLVSWLGRVLSSPPPDYAAAWWESEPTALSHSADVADIVCRLWNRLHTDPALTEAQLPPGAATAIESLRALVMGWAERWGLPQSPSGVSIWSKRSRRGAGDLISGGGLTIDTGPPLIELRPGEHDRLLWVFRKLEKIGLAIRQRQQVLSGTPAPTLTPPLATNDVTAPASPRGEAPAPAGNAPRASGNEAPTELPDLVTLDQAAALVNRSTRTLERYKKGNMPKPFVRGGGGKPHEYRWSEMRAWLERIFDRPIPETAIDRFRHPKIADRH